MKNNSKGLGPSYSHVSTSTATLSNNNGQTDSDQERESRGLLTTTAQLMNAQGNFRKFNQPSLLASSNDDEGQDTEQVDVDQPQWDNFLGRLRRGIQVVCSHARTTMANCSSEREIDEMQSRLESSTLHMIKAEKSFVENARIVTEVVDVFASDYDHTDHKSCSSSNLAQKVDNGDKDPADTECSPSQPNAAKPLEIFWPTKQNIQAIRNYGNKLSEIMSERMDNFRDTLTEEVLRKESSFKELQRQIVYGKRDRERREMGFGAVDDLPGSGGDAPVQSLCLHPSAEDYDNNEIFVSSSSQPNNASFYESHEELDSDSGSECDESVLPCTDPITRKPIENAVRNKVCNHVFDFSSISAFMMRNPNARCPMEGCRNERVLAKDQFAYETKLTLQIRRKNAKML